MNAKGKTLLKVSGVLLIIFGGLSTILSLIGTAAGGSALFLSFTNSSSVPNQSTKDAGIFTAIVVLMLIVCAFELITGIIGIKNCNKPEKAKLCIILGGILIVLTLFSSVTDIITNGFNFYVILSMIIGLIIPCLYCYGALLNKKSLAQ